MSRYGQATERALKHAIRVTRGMPIASNRGNGRRTIELNRLRLRVGKVTEAGGITAGGNGQVTVWRGVEKANETYITELDWMHGGDDISQGKEVLIGYFPDEQIWRIIMAECEDPPPQGPISFFEPIDPDVVTDVDLPAGLATGSTFTIKNITSSTTSFDVNGIGGESVETGAGTTGATVSLSGSGGAWMFARDAVANVWWQVSNA